jgi:nicotinate-nucleotide pyrophosphorylase (carboxylating)
MSAPTPSIPDPATLHPLLKLFLEEDGSFRDVTSEATVPASLKARGRFVAKSALVLAGIDVALEAFLILDPQARLEARMKDGALLARGDEPAWVFGQARALLGVERVALNLLQRLSGIATLTHSFVAAIEGTGAEILDTRKTTPGLRALEKYAVRVSGGRNHRMGLSDAVLIKENHIRVAGGIRHALTAARSVRKSAQIIEIEVTSVAELDEALDGAPDAVLLDNMTPSEVAQAVRRVQALKSKVVLEASGGITLANVRQYAEAGVNWISVGALTHSAPAADISFEIEPVGP